MFGIQLIVGMSNTQKPFSLGLRRIAVCVANGQNRSAWRWEKAWVGGSGFSDKQVVYGLSDDWLLQEIVDATSTETLVGNGSKSGMNRAFLLIPQTKTP